jgi:hypothetical protein
MQETAGGSDATLIGWGLEAVSILQMFFALIILKISSSDRRSCARNSTKGLLLCAIP